MSRIKECMKREVVCMAEGIKLGRPADILLDLDDHRVALILLSRARTPHLFLTVPASAVQSFDAATLPIGTIDDVTLAYRQPALMRFVERDIHMRGRDVLTSGGEIIGHVVDVDLDEQGNVRQYFVRKGLLDLLLMRKHPVLPSDLRTAGEQVAILEEVPAEPSGEAENSATPPEEPAHPPQRP
jgi:uncharacterized protein YrrD